MKYFDAFSGYGGFTLAINNVYANNQDRKHLSEWWSGRCGDRPSRDKPNDSIRKEGGYSKYADCVGFSEIDKYACQVYQFQYPNHKNYGSITDIDETTLPDFDLFTGGFPCQSFSVAGKRGGFDDTRGTLIFDVLRICAYKKPKYILLENVKGLLSHDNGRTFGTILEALQEIGYGVSWKVLNAKYFGVPQNRERVFILCVRGEPAPEILPVSGENQSSLFAGRFHQRNEQRLASCKERQEKKQCAGNPPDQERGAGASNQCLPFAKVRRLTPLECERLMGLPDNWTKQGTEGEISDTQRYKLCGNGVVVNCVEAIIKQITGGIN